MKKRVEEDPRIKVKGKGMDGKLIVQARKFYREIPVVLFSSNEANTLLQIVDKIEIERQSVVIKKSRF